MNSPSPFAAIQAIQEEQREGYAPPKRMTPLQESMDMRQQLAEKDAKIAEQAAQIVALRGCLEHLTSKDWYQDGEDEKVVCVLNGKIVRAALSTPAPPVVPLEDVRPLLDALKIIAANPGASHGPSCLYDSGPIATGAIAKFNAKHPQP